MQLAHRPRHGIEIPAWLGWLIVWPCITALPAAGQVTAQPAILYFDFSRGLTNLAADGGTLQLEGGLALPAEKTLDFDQASQFARLDEGGMRHLSTGLRQTRELTVGGWFLCRRVEPQVFLARGSLQIGELGDVLFRPHDHYINFCLGCDPRGFIMGTIHGNGSMPFPHVTINRIPVLTWQQLVVVKDPDGYHHFYQNGSNIHDDRLALSAPSRHAWRETDAGWDVPLELRMPAGGSVGELWVVGRALTADEVAADYQAKRHRYRPAPPGKTVELRDMDTQAPAEPVEFDRQRVRENLLRLFGSFPAEVPELAPQVLEETDCGSYVRRKVAIHVQPQDRMPLYLLVPKQPAGRTAAIVCFYGTTSGAGKETTVGLSGRRPGDAPHANLSFAIDMAEAGFVAVAPDYLRDGERIHPGDRPYDTTRFYEQFPDWSIHGKDAWDTMRLIDYLETLEFVDPDRIGMVGHSYGGHSTLFTAALEPRIRAAVANGPVSAFREHGGHWGVPKGAGNSQSLPAMRPYILNPDLPLPITFAELTALTAPRPLLIGQAAGERRPLEEENAAYVQRVYQLEDAADRVRYVWYAGDHDFPPAARTAAVDWFRHWLASPGKE
jgi:dienelactone hydrolase